jgi:hypothetical protein
MTVSVTVSWELGKSGTRMPAFSLKSDLLSINGAMEISGKVLLESETMITEH